MKIDTSGWAENYWSLRGRIKYWALGVHWDYECPKSLFLKPSAYNSRILQEILC